MDSEVLNWDYPKEVPEYSPEYFVTWFREVIQHMLDRADREKELAKTHEYSQVWLMSKEGWESLPANPTIFDILGAGGQFIGYQWVKKGT